MGHFLFANTLLPAVLRAPVDGRVLIVSSETHRGRPDAPTVLNLEDLFVEGIPEAMGGFIRYGRSKLANLLYAKQLARRLQVRPEFDHFYTRVSHRHQLFRQIMSDEPLIKPEVRSGKNAEAFLDSRA